MARRTPEPQPALGQAVRELRRKHELSQKALAKAARLHPTWVAHIEAGRVNPAWGTVRRIAAGLKVPVSELAARAESLESRANSRN